jgi:competence protein ComFC
MPGPLAYRFYQSIWSVLDWLYPPNCGGCGQAGVRWCANCARDVQLATTPLCPICGASQPSSDLCRRCKESPPHYAALRSWAIFGGGIRNAIHKLKYQRDIALGEILSRPMITLVQSLNWSIDLVTPVPLGLARLAERGYNQAALLGRPIALYLELPYRPKIINRVRETRSQVGLSLELRRDNVAGAFQARREVVARKNVLVVDDVTTSGSTLDACAEALIDAGACQVFCLTLARAASKTQGALDAI